MAELDTSRLSPADAAVTMRSLPRRFRAALGSIGDEEQAAEVAERIGPDGHSALDHLAAVVGTLSLLERALEQVLVDDRPTLHPATMDRQARSWEPPAERGLEPTLDELSEAAARMADRIERAGADDWSRTGEVPGGRSVTALDLVREAVATAIDHLREAERTMAAVKGRPPSS
jgi:hypothetical protein